MKNTPRGKSIFKIAVWTVVAVIALGAAFWGSVGIQYFFVKNSGLPVETILPPAPEYEKPAVFGARYPYRTVFAVPWGTTLEKAEITPGSGIQSPVMPKLELAGYGWGVNEYVLLFDLQAYRNEGLSESVLNVEFRLAGGKTCPFEFKIPPPEVVLPENENEADTELKTAGILEEQPHKTLSAIHYIAMACVGLILVVLALFVFRDFFKKTAQAAQISLQDATIGTIRELENNVRKHAVSASAALAELSNIVRHYLEKRFALPAERRTTEEFFSTLERSGSPLENKDRGFLKGFLEAADMVKFARLDADAALFEKASESAVGLVENSRPETEDHTAAKPKAGDEK